MHIKNIRGSPNQASARILFELVDEENAFIGNDKGNEIVFETMEIEQIHEDQARFIKSLERMTCSEIVMVRVFSTREDSENFVSALVEINVHPIDTYTIQTSYTLHLHFSQLYRIYISKALFRTVS